jgi:hypothetical protein
MYAELLTGSIILSNGCRIRQRGEKRFEGALAVIALTINEETWRAVDSGTYSAPKLFPNALGMGVRNHFLQDTCFVQPEGSSLRGAVAPFLFDRNWLKARASQS